MVQINYYFSLSNLWLYPEPTQLPGGESLVFIFFGFSIIAQSVKVVEVVAGTSSAL